MATRFYLPSSGSPAVAPASFAANWGQTANFQDRPLVTAFSNTALTTDTATNFAEVSASAIDVLHWRGTSAPLAAQTISGTFSAVVAILESATTADAYLQIVIRLVDSAGAAKSTLYAGDTGAVVATVGAATEEAPTTIGTRIKSALALTSQTAAAGDRLVIEIGERFTNVSATSRNGSLRFGDATGSTDYALTSGLAVGTTNTPWVELSATLTFIALVTGVDTGTLTEGTSVVSLGTADSFALAESAATNRGTTDSATLSEGTPTLRKVTDWSAIFSGTTQSGPVAKSATDTGTLTDANAGESLTGTTDTGTLTDANAGVALTGTFELVGFTESASHPGAFELAGFTEVSSVVQNATGLDTGTLTESASALSVTVGTADSFALAESTGAAGTPATTDSAALSDASSVRKTTDWSAIFSGTTQGSAVSKSASDSMAVTDVSALTVALTVLDSGTLTEPTPSGAATLNRTDAGTLAEVAAVSMVVIASDSVAFTEDITDTQVTDAAAEITLAGESASVNTGGTAPSGTDAFALSEATTGTAAGSATDSAALSEGVPVITTATGVSDALALLEAVLISAGVTASDTGTLGQTAFPSLPFTAADTLTFVEASAVVAPFVPPAGPFPWQALDDLINVWFKTRAAGTTTADAMLNYFRARSGLPANRSLSDHMSAYYAGGLGVIDADTPLTDLEIAFWKAVDPTNSVGSWAQRARRFYGA